MKKITNKKTKIMGTNQLSLNIAEQNMTVMRRLLFLQEAYMLTNINGGFSAEELVNKHKIGGVFYYACKKNKILQSDFKGRHSYSKYSAEIMPNIKMASALLEFERKYFKERNEIKRTAKKQIIVDTKKCTKCGTVLPISEFHKNKSKKSGLHEECKKCYSEYQKNKRNKNILGLLVKKCDCCHEVKPLTEFHAAKASKDGYQKTCKECKNMYLRAERKLKSDVAKKSTITVKVKKTHAPVKKEIGLIRKFLKFLWLSL